MIIFYNFYIKIKHSKTLARISDNMSILLGKQKQQAIVV